MTNYYELVLDLVPNHLTSKYNYVLYVTDDTYSYPVYDWQDFIKAWRVGRKDPIYDLIPFESPYTLYGI